jgi:hypothetical protein
MIAVGIDRNTNGGGNTSVVFGQFQSFSKGIRNCIINTGSELQPGDLVHKGWKDANTWWEAATYNGGNILDMNNYTPLIEIEMDTLCTISGGSGGSGQSGSTEVPHFSAAHFSSLHFST